MIPIDQTKFGMPNGNCMAACIASILEIPIETVKIKESDSWYKDVNGWLHTEHGLALMTVTKIPYWFKGYLILCGVSPRNIEHATVGQVVEGVATIVHDPHPSRDGIADITEIMVLVKSD